MFKPKMLKVNSGLPQFRNGLIMKGNILNFIKITLAVQGVIWPHKKSPNYNFL